MLNGTSWYLNETLQFTVNPPPIGYLLYNENGLFTCDGVTYYGINFLTLLLTDEVAEVEYNTSRTQTVTAYNNNNHTWTNSKYRTITFIGELNWSGDVAEEFEAWLESNATKTGDSTKYLVTGTELLGVANAIRAKTGGTSKLSFPDDFISSIGSL